MKYNPEIHHRSSVRLKGYDYSRAGLYYITICCADRICRFGNIGMNFVGAGLAPAHDSNAPAHLNAPAPTMILNEYGLIACDEWIKLPQRFHNMELDIYQIMPNHIHAIIILNDPVVGAGLAPAHDSNAPAHLNTPSQNVMDVSDNRAGVNPAPTIGVIIGVYKSLVSNACLEIFKSRNEKMDKLWQRNYYEHIIRDEISLYNISEYIVNNPLNWGKDEFFDES